MALFSQYHYQIVHCQYIEIQLILYILLRFLNSYNNFLCIVSVIATVSLMRISLTTLLKRGQSQCSISQSSICFFRSCSKFVNVLSFMCSFMKCLSSFAFVLFPPLKCKLHKVTRHAWLVYSFSAFTTDGLVHKTCSINTY